MRRITKKAEYEAEMAKLKQDLKRDYRAFKEQVYNARKQGQAINRRSELPLSKSGYSIVMYFVVLMMEAVVIVAPMLLLGTVEITAPILLQQIWVVCVVVIASLVACMADTSAGVLLVVTNWLILSVFFYG